MSYTSDIASTGTPDHHWTFDNTDNDEIGPANLTTGSGGGYVTTPLTTSGERTHSFRFTDDGHSKGCPDQVTMNLAPDTQKRSMGGWFQISGEIPPRPITIWKEGGTGANMISFLGYGGQIAGQILENNPSWAVQSFGIPAALDRPYHWLLTFSGSNFDNRVRLYVDGVPVGTYLPASAAPDSPSFLIHGGDIYWGDSDSDLAVGGSPVGFDGMSGNSSELFVADWASWFDQELTQANARFLFEQGAKPFSVITSDTEANMQTQADALGVMPDYPLCLEIEDVSGGGDLDLTLDGVTFDSLASLHIRWLGTGTLTLTLTNGSNPDLAGKVHTPNGGAIVENVTYDLTFDGLQPNTEVRIYEAGTTMELGGIENTSGSFVYSHNGSGSIDYVIFNKQYLPIDAIDFPLPTSNTLIPIQQIFDRNYRNP